MKNFWIVLLLLAVSACGSNQQTDTGSGLGLNIVDYQTRNQPEEVVEPEPEIEEPFEEEISLEEDEEATEEQGFFSRLFGSDEDTTSEEGEETTQEGDNLAAEGDETATDPLEGLQIDQEALSEEASLLSSVPSLSDVAKVLPTYEKRSYAEYINESSLFKVNQAVNYYGVDIAVLEIPKGILTYSSSTSGQEEEMIKINDQNEGLPDEVLGEDELKLRNITKEREDLSVYFRNRDLIKDSSRPDLEVFELTETHVDVLGQLTRGTTPNKNYIIIQYMNSSMVKDWKADSEKIERNIYSNYLYLYLIRNYKNIRVEKRYLETVPENELFLVLLNYEGEIPKNVYNTERENSLRWLERYQELEQEKYRTDLERRRELSEILENPEVLLETVEEDTAESLRTRGR